MSASAKDASCEYSARDSPTEGSENTVTGSIPFDILINAVTTAAVIAATLGIPLVRQAAGRYVSGLVQHKFDEKIEKLKSQLRLDEEITKSALATNERKISSLIDATLSIRGNRHSELNARRLKAVEKLWAAKISADRFKMAAKFVARLNLEEAFKAADKNDARVFEFVATLDRLSGVNLDTDPLISARSEQPFLTPSIWALFSAYQGVLFHAVVVLKAFSNRAAKYIKREDLLKPLMLQILPEYREYIEQYGASAYFYLLDDIEEKLLSEIYELLDGRSIDAVSLRASASLIETIDDLRNPAPLEIPEGLQGPGIPSPQKTNEVG